MEHVIFLDLEISKEGDHFCLRNNFKPTDRNSYIPLESCHHRSWLCNFPRGQFIRLRRNCTHEDDYISQSQVLASRFQQKGYEKSALDSEIERVCNMDRNVLVSNQIRDNDIGVPNFKMVLNFNVQHKKFERIFQKNWSILKQDKVLGPLLPSRPSFTYKKPPPFVIAWHLVSLIHLLNQKIGYFRSSRDFVPVGNALPADFMPVGNALPAGILNVILKNERILCLQRPIKSIQFSNLLHVPLLVLFTCSNVGVVFSILAGPPYPSTSHWASM